MKLVRIAAVEPAQGRTLRVTFTSGERRDIDVGPLLVGPIFDAIREQDTAFREVRVEGGTVTWPNGADLDPDVLYYNGTPPWARAVVESAAP